VSDATSPSRAPGPWRPSPSPGRVSGPAERPSPHGRALGPGRPTPFPGHGQEPSRAASLGIIRSPPSTPSPPRTDPQPRKEKESLATEEKEGSRTE
jgi:hypothetical protein